MFFQFQWTKVNSVTVASKPVVLQYFEQQPRLKHVCCFQDSTVSIVISDHCHHVLSTVGLRLAVLHLLAKLLVVDKGQFGVHAQHLDECCAKAVFLRDVLPKLVCKGSIQAVEEKVDRCLIIDEIIGIVLGLLDFHQALDNDAVVSLVVLGQKQHDVWVVRILDVSHCITTNLVQSLGKVLTPLFEISLTLSQFRFDSNTPID